MRESSRKSKRKIVDGVYKGTQDSCEYIHRRATGYVTANNRLVMVMMQGCGLGLGSCTQLPIDGLELHCTTGRGFEQTAALVFKLLPAQIS